MNTIVKVGVCALSQGITDVNMVRKIANWDLGNLIGYVNDADDAAFCKKHKIYFFVSELRHRGRLNETWCFPIRCFKNKGRAFYENPVKELARVKKAGGKYYLGRSIAGEYGGHIYCSRECLGHPLADDKEQLSDEVFPSGLF